MGDPVAARVQKQLERQRGGGGGTSGARVPPAVAALVILLAVGVALAFVGNASATGPECRMNGFGTGVCAFTNLGALPWSSCGRVTLSSHVSGKSARSSEFCSGYLWPRSTVSVEFLVPEARELCAGGRSWTEDCSLTFDRAP